MKVTTNKLDLNLVTINTLNEGNCFIYQKGIYMITNISSVHINVIVLKESYTFPNKFRRTFFGRNDDDKGQLIEMDWDNCSLHLEYK